MVGATGVFYQVMESYVAFMDEMVAMEDTKYKALLSGDIQRMDKAISDQQAMLKRLEKFEEQREAAQREAGFDGLLFREIIDKLDADDRPAFMGLFEKLSRQVEVVQHQNEKSMSFADMNLYINDLLPTESPQDTGYNAGGEKHKGDSDRAGTVFQTKI